MWMNEVAFQGSTLIKIVVACCQPSARRAEVASMVQKGTVLRDRSCLKLIFQEKSFAAIILSGQANCSFNSGSANLLVPLRIALGMGVIGISENSGLSNTTACNLAFSTASREICNSALPTRSPGPRTTAPVLRT